MEFSPENDIMKLNYYVYRALCCLNDNMFEEGDDPRIGDLAISYQKMEYKYGKKKVSG